jgi:hypothetical protein
MRYKTTDPNIQWESTGYIKVHNFPPSPMTFSYITRTYRQWKKGSIGWEEIEGEAIYFHDLKDEARALAIIIGNAQNVLSNTLPRESFLKPIIE